MSRGDANLFFFVRVDDDDDDDDDDASNPRLLDSVDTRENVCMRESMFCYAPEQKKEGKSVPKLIRVGTKNTTNLFLFSLSQTNRTVALLLRACSDANTNTNTNTNANTRKGMGRRGS